MQLIKRVLIVEDDEWVREATEAIMEVLGLECATVGNPLDALDVLEVGGFDVVLSDICMPYMDGFELLYEIRHRWPGVPVILCSGYYDKSRMARAIPRLPVLDKPYKMDTLQHAFELAEQYVGRPETNKLCETEKTAISKAMVLNAEDPVKTFLK